jgi:hypothetical protein
MRKLFSLLFSPPYLFGHVITFGKARKGRGVQKKRLVRNSKPVFEVLQKALIN